MFVLPKVEIPEDDENMSLVPEAHISVALNHYRRYVCRINIRRDVNDMYCIYVDDALINFFRAHLVQRNATFRKRFISNFRNKICTVNEINEFVMTHIESHNKIARSRVADFFSSLTQANIKTLFRRSQINHDQISLSRTVYYSCSPNAVANNNISQYIEVFRSYKKRYPKISFLPLLMHPNWNRHFTDSDAFLKLFE